MVSVAGGWFFLMACEMFEFGHRDFRLPGLGSYLQTAAGHGDMPAILWGLGTMILVIVLIDQLIWRPVISWADKFKFEQTESTDAPRSPILALLRRSRALEFLRARTTGPMIERLCQGGRRVSPKATRPASGRSSSVAWTAGALFASAVLYGLFRSALLLRGLTPADLAITLEAAGATFLRVNVSLLIAALWTIPAGVAIGFHPRLARIAQPLAQIAASVPATALFPIVLLGLIQVGGGLGVASILLMLLGTQWYILFNVIAGAMAIPSDLKEVSSVFRFASRATLAHADPAGHLPVPRHRAGYRVRRRLERQHRRRVSTASPASCSPPPASARKSAPPATPAGSTFCCSPPSSWPPSS